MVFIEYCRGIEHYCHGLSKLQFWWLNYYQDWYLSNHNVVVNKCITFWYMCRWFMLLQQPYIDISLGHFEWNNSASITCVDLHLFKFTRYGFADITFWYMCRWFMLLQQPYIDISLGHFEWNNSASITCVDLHLFKFTRYGFADI